MITYITRITSVFGAWSRRKRTGLVVVLGTLTVALVAGSAFLTILAENGRRQEQTTQEALARAEKLVPEILSYDFNTVEDELTSSLEHLGGEFRNQFESVSKNVIVPSAKERQVVTEATVVESSVVSAAPDTATVLMFVNQSTTSTDGPAPKLDGSRVQVTLHHNDSGWQITEMAPV